MNKELTKEQMKFIMGGITEYCQNLRIILETSDLTPEESEMIRQLLTDAGCQ